jgi:hypothetical protein
VARLGDTVCANQKIRFVRLIIDRLYHARSSVDPIHPTIGRESNSVTAIMSIVYAHVVQPLQ